MTLCTNGHQLDYPNQICNVCLERAAVMKPLTFEELRFANVQRNKEWDPENKLTPAFSGLEFGGEVGELLEESLTLLQLAILAGKISNMVKKLERERLGIQGSRVTLFEMAKEAADAQITLDLLCMRYSIDLGEATRLKFNATSEKMGLLTRL